VNFNWGLEGVLRENNCILRVISRQLGASLGIIESKLIIVMRGLADLINESEGD
jgi:hypothetical protein